MQTAATDDTLTPQADIMAIDTLVRSGFANSILHLVNRDAQGLNLLKRGKELQYIAYRSNTKPFLNY